MINNIKSWIEKNPFPFALIVAVITVILTLGVIYGVGYLQFQDYDLDFQEERFRDLPEENVIGVTYHHTATSDRSIEGHHDFHTDVRGWAGVGYHFQVRSDGTLEVGRPLSIQGAHAGGEANRQTIGVAISGNFDQNRPPQEQLEAVAELHVWLERVYFNKKLELFEHSDWMNTSCAGNHFDLNKLEELIEKERQYRDELDEVEVDYYIQDVVDGRILNNESKGFLIDSRTYVPIREVSETLGYDVNWDAENRVWEVAN